MQVQYLERILDKQFELANLQRPDYDIEEEPVYIADLMHDVVLKFAALANAHALDLKFIGDPLANFRVSADVMLIERVLDNLIDNAIRHAKGATCVMLEVHAAPDDVQVCVWDDGPGLPQVLEAWLRGQTLTQPPRSRTDTSGSGLGFRIVLRILELHSSRLIVSRVDGRGTCLCFRLFRYEGTRIVPRGVPASSARAER
jgi:signal transduction histidine kinase